MPPEIDNSKPKNEPAPLIDFYSFNQGAVPMSDKNSGSNSGAQKGSIELSDPYGFHQGLRSLANALDRQNTSGASGNKGPGELKPGDGSNKGEAKDRGPGSVPAAEVKGKNPNEPNPGQSKDKPPTQPKDSNNPPVDLSHILPNPFIFHQGDKTPTVVPRPGEPRPFIPPKDVTPLPVTPSPSIPDARPDQRPDVKPVKPGDIPTDIGGSRSGMSPIVEAYERKQGARHAGDITLPPIDAIPSVPTDLIPPTPGPGPAPGPRPDIAPWVPPKIDDKPPIKPVDWRPNPTPDVVPNPDKPNPSDLISKIEPKYETDDIATAIKMAKDTGLPLAVHIGASWCHYCVQMEQNTWPSVEGTSDRKGSLQGKMVVLHMDVDEANNLSGENARLAREVLRNRGGSVPLLRVFKVDSSGHLTKTNEHNGAINSRSQLENFLIRGGVQR